MRTGARSLLCCVALLAACGKEFEPPVRPPRPVSYVTLQSLAPAAATRLAGTVDSWKRVEVGFEVGGRVVHMVDAGTEIQGEIVDVSGKRRTPGTVIARLDDERYGVDLKEQKALLASAEAKVKASQTELESVIPEKLKAAQADLVLQDQEVKRYTRMVAENSAPQERLDQIRAAYKVAQSTVAEAESLFVIKAAEVAAVQAQVRVAQAMVERARLNVEDCTLFAPFSGQIARTHVILGGYVLRGQQVVTLQMMDPIKVQIALSPRLDAQINYNDRVKVYLPDSGEVLKGFVYLKDTFADPATRTYLATLLVRNRRVEAGEDVVKDASTPRATDLMPLEKRDPRGPGPYFTEVGSLHEDGDGFYVWKAEGLKSRDLWEDYDPRVKVKKVRVTLGDGLLDLVHLFTFRELADHGELNPGEDLVLRGVTGEVKDGDEVLLVRERWLLRPGDVVRVGLRGAELEPGFYVPEAAIQFDGQSHSVYTIQSQSDGRRTAAQVEVRIGETVGELQRIEAVEDSRLAEGMQLVVSGAHYIVDGEAINPVEEVALAQ